VRGRNSGDYFESQNKVVEAEVSTDIFIDDIKKDMSKHDFFGYRA
jgi:hypothetical protein